jgi:tetratricopeptide (TPR) repeat protein
MVHMPSHIDVRVGAWQKAVISNQKAIIADSAYRDRRPRIGFYRLYMAHNRHMLAHAAMMRGQSKIAVQAMDEMVAAIPEEAIEAMGPVLDGYFAMPWEVRVRFGKWDEILALQPPHPSLVIANALMHHARGIAYAAKGNLDKAYEEERLMLEVIHAMPAEAWMGMNSGHALMAVAQPLLRGEILVAEGNLNAGIASLRQAVEAEDQLRYDEPPDWINPCRHALGAALMKAGRFAEAESVYKEDLKKQPHNGWSLLGLLEAQRSLGKTRDARQSEAAFNAAWKDADLSITSSCMCMPKKKS